MGTMDNGGKQRKDIKSFALLHQVICPPVLYRLEQPQKYMYAYKPSVFMCKYVFKILHLNVCAFLKLSQEQFIGYFFNFSKEFHA